MICDGKYEFGEEGRRKKRTRHKIGFSNRWGRGILAEFSLFVGIIEGEIGMVVLSDREKRRR